MKRLLAVMSIVVSILLLSSCWLMEKTIVGEGDFVESEYEVDDAKNLVIENVALQFRGNAFFAGISVLKAEEKDERKVVLSGQQNIIDSINVKSKDDTLTISGNSFEIYDTEAFTIYIYGYEFEKFNLSDVRGNVESDIKGDNVSFELLGSSYLSCSSFNTTNLNINLTDGSQLVAKDVTANNTEFTIADSSRCIIDNLKATKIKSRMNGSSYLKAAIESDDIDFVMSKNASGNLSGNVKKAKLELSGLAKLDAIILVVETVSDCDVMGASELSIHVTNSLKCYVTGTSIFTYKGNCTASIESAADSIVKYIEE